MTDILETLLEKARAGKALPVYLFHGEPFSLPSHAARRLVEALVPEADRDFGLSVHDGARARAVEILDDANSLSLLGGRRAVLVKETTLFLSKRDAKKVLEACRERWEASQPALGAGAPDGDIPADAEAADWEGEEADGDQGTREPTGRGPAGATTASSSGRASAEANRHRAATDLLALAAAAGWSLANLADDSDEAARRWQKDFGIKLGERGGEWEEFSRWLRAVHDFCVGRGIDLPATVGERETIERGLERGLPPGSSLVFTCRKADPSLGLYKLIERMGAVVSLQVEERDASSFTRATAERVARALGVGISPQALKELEGLLEPNPERIEQEIEKLAAFCGPGGKIEITHVRTAIERTRLDPIYRFQEAVGERDLRLALVLLDETLSQGNLSPQMRALGALGALSSAVRKLLRMRALIEGPLDAEMRRGELPYAVFQSRILPRLLDDPRAGSLKGRHPFGIWKDLLRARNFRLPELVGALAELARADRALKLSPGEPRLIVEEVILHLLAPAAPG